MHDQNKSVRVPLKFHKYSLTSVKFARTSSVSASQATHFHNSKHKFVHKIILAQFLRNLHHPPLRAILGKFFLQETQQIKITFEKFEIVWTQGTRSLTSKTRGSISEGSGRCITPHISHFAFKEAARVDYPSARVTLLPCKRSAQLYLPSGDTRFTFGLQETKCDVNTGKTNELRLNSHFFSFAFE